MAEADLRSDRSATEVVPLAFLRPITGAGSLAFTTDLISQFGPDSLVGRIASTIQGSTDTTLYVITVYFGAIGIRKASYALKVGLISDASGLSLPSLSATSYSFDGKSRMEPLRYPHIYCKQSTRKR